jgi:hypothetical protein
MYPTLPGVNAMAEGANGFSAGGAPPTGLGSSFDPEMRRRFSGGQLQQGAPDSDKMDTDETPTQSPRDSPMPKVDKLGIHSPAMRNANLDPALRSPGAISDGSSEYADKQQEAWIENVRTIELLRSFVKEKLERGDFVHDSDEEDEDVPKSKTEEDEAASLYPVLKEVQDN